MSTREDFMVGLLRKRERRRKIRQRERNAVYRQIEKDFWKSVKTRRSR